MTKLKMGRHNCVSAERFHTIKAAMAEGLSDAAIMAKYDIKKTTLKYIKKSTNFYEYRLFTEILPAARKMPTVIAPSSGLAFEDFSYKKRKKDKVVAERRASREDEATNKMVALVTIAVTWVIALVALDALASFWNQK